MVGGALLRVSNREPRSLILETGEDAALQACNYGLKP